ncbi:hypothetical protein ABB37_05542 [Leptomonas pyrrhocoris]|uniref:Transmembrane protein n=1 Tax=Leptomonas pyrrhocoris TaxID=157538 RepID=A0A0M9FZE1_LEPPY|nr:hypothetical protein ABB37_05542 [Leptomonas pyrrhocoris]KPA78996.1 hypothetical protein ABB37_05542 [Leptomonas pyrrhocoris]|eukprot:XP_015657435.1 hypothetical protein ABB37_05542 [Leptomonas pyrrhocoris]
MFRSLLRVSLVVWCTITSVAFAADNLALDFTSNIVLENAVLNTTFNVTGNFTSSVAELLQNSFGSSALKARVFNVYPHLVVSTEAWYSGAASSVETSVNTINTTYEKLAADDSLAVDVSGKLSHLCMRNIGQQPTVVDYTNNCSFFNEALAPGAVNSTCPRNLTVSIYTNNSDPVSMRTALCNFLPTDCDLITNVTASQVSVTINGTQVLVYLMPFTITAQDREATLTLLVAYAHYASFLVEQKIVYILVNGVRVFYQGDMQQLWAVGTMSQCAQRMWYLIFLIILVPVILILSQQMYYWGRRSGKRSIKNAEKDIRAGVHLSNMPWANFGSSGYQYGPPQGYPGGYGGAELQQQVNPYMQQSLNPPQFYGQQWGGPQFGGPQQFGSLPQQQYGGLQRQQQSQVPPGTLTNRNAQWPYNGQQPQANPNQWGGYSNSGAQAGWGQQQ